MNASQELFSCEMSASILVVNPKILITLMVLNTLTSITATIGNLLVLVTIWRSPNLHCSANTLLFGLALSDLCIGVISEPLNVVFQADLLKNSGKTTSCALMNARTFISVFLTTVTLLTVTAMSVDRYLAIYLHLRYDQVVTEKRTRIAILYIWLISSASLVINIFDAMTSYSVVTLIIAVCLAIISFAWIKIYQVARNHRAQIQDQMAVATQSFNMARFRNSATNTLLVLLIVVFCYTPFLVSKIFLAVNLKRSNVVFLEISYIFVLLNSSLNPFVYFWRQRDLRARTKELVMTFCGQRQ